MDWFISRSFQAPAFSLVPLRSKAKEAVVVLFVAGYCRFFALLCFVVALFVFCWLLAQAFNSVN
jgi:hypothetical protein